MEQILLFAGIGTVISLAITLTVLKIIASKSVRWILYACLILVGVGILFIWPPESNNGRMKIHDPQSALGLALIFPSLFTLFIHSATNINKNVRKDVINKAQEIAKAFDLEVVGLPVGNENRYLRDIHLWHKGILNNTWNFHLSSHIETPYSPTVALEKRKKIHYRKIVMAVPLNPDFYARIVATRNRIDVPQLEKKSHGFVSNNERFDQEVKIYSSNQSSVVHFFQKYEIQQLLIANKDYINGFIDMNQKENLISLSFRQFTYPKVSIFSLNLQEKITAHEIEELKKVFEFLKKFIYEWEKLNSH
ncbi:MAG: hypothetical protein ACK476_05625 [Fluviicola sp.]